MCQKRDELRIRILHTFIAHSGDNWQTLTNGKERNNGSTHIGVVKP